MRFFIYSRKSVSTGKGDSVENQIVLCRQFISARFPETTEEEIHVYEDEGYSGKTLQRPQFQQMYGDFQRYHPDFLVCYRLDRISRSIGDFASLFEDLNKKSIGFLCIKENFDTSTPMGKAMLYITSVFAQLERETIGERVRDNMALLARSGRWLGGTPPLGFRSEMVVNAQNKKEARLAVFPEEMEVVLGIFKEYERKHSLSAVEKFLVARGVQGRNGGGFSLLGIKEVLENPVYCAADWAAYQHFQYADICFDQTNLDDRRGLMVYNKRNYQTAGGSRQPVAQWVVAVGRHPAVISGDRWVNVQKILESNVPNGKKAAKIHNDYSVFSGLIRCASCGEAMFAKARWGKTGFDYVCKNKLRGGRSRCATDNINGLDGDRRIAEVLLAHINGDGAIAANLEAMKKAVAKDDPWLEAKEKVRKYQSEIHHWMEILQESSPSDALVGRIDQRIGELESAMEHWAQVVEQGESTTVSAEQVDSAVAHLADFRQLFFRANNALLRDFFREITEELIWDGQDIHVVWL